MNYDIPITAYLPLLKIGTLGLQLYYLLNQSRNNNRITVFYNQCGFPGSDLIVINPKWFKS
jgi:hypothetical protein